MPPAFLGLLIRHRRAGGTGKGKDIKTREARLRLTALLLVSLDTNLPSSPSRSYLKLFSQT
jgi:hypothetical protein